jgi:hypothetical protein
MHVDIDTADFFGIAIAGDMTFLVNDQHLLSGAVGLAGKNLTKQTCTHHQVIVSGFYQSILHQSFVASFPIAINIMTVFHPAPTAWFCGLQQSVSRPCLTIPGYWSLRHILHQTFLISMLRDLKTILACWFWIPGTGMTVLVITAPWIATVANSKKIGAITSTATI